MFCANIARYMRMQTHVRLATGIDIVHILGLTECKKEQSASFNIRMSSATEQSMFGASRISTMKQTRATLLSSVIAVIYKQ